MFSPPPQLFTLHCKVSVETGLKSRETSAVGQVFNPSNWCYVQLVLVDVRLHAKSAVCFGQVENLSYELLCFGQVENLSYELLVGSLYNAGCFPLISNASST